MNININGTPEEISKMLDFGYNEGLDPTDSDAFNLIVAIDLSQESYEFTYAVYQHFKREIEKEDAIDG
jgi:hypothetical protein